MPGIGLVTVVTGAEMTRLRTKLSFMLISCFELSAALGFSRGFGLGRLYLCKPVRVQGPGLPN